MGRYHWRHLNQHACIFWGAYASVDFGPTDLRSIVRLDGKPVVGLSVIRQARSNTIEISDEVFFAVVATTVVLVVVFVPIAFLPSTAGRLFREFGGDFEMALTGDNYLDIYQAALDFTKQIEDRLPELGRVEIYYESTQPQLRVSIDRRRAEELGVAFDDVSRTLRAAINGDDIVYIRAC